jgi:DNA-directed RNA polymerase alpha subunit
MNEKESSITLRLSNTKREFANAIRRFARTHVPTMSIARLLIYENTSLMSNLDLKDRIQLVPLKCSRATVLAFQDVKENCKKPTHGSCDKCSTKFTLRVHNTSNQNIMVTNQDLIPEQKQVGKGAAL